MVLGLIYSLCFSRLTGVWRDYINLVFTKGDLPAKFQKALLAPWLLERPMADVWIPKSWRNTLKVERFSCGVEELGSCIIFWRHQFSSCFTSVIFHVDSWSSPCQPHYALGLSLGSVGLRDTPSKLSSPGTIPIDFTWLADFRRGVLCNVKRIWAPQ